MMWFYFYEVKYWVEDYLRAETERGFVRATSLRDATSQLCSWYGDDHIDRLSLYAIEDGDSPLTVDRITKTLDKVIKDVE